MTLQNKTALVTGGNSGIGLATARLLVAQGARVAITGRDRSRLDAAVAELGTQAIGIQADITEPEAIEAMAKAVEAAFGTLDILFVNAGVSAPSPLGKTTLEAFETVVRTNMTAVYFTVQAVLPLLTDGASVVLNGSVMRQLGTPGSAAYAASKAGVSAMARVFASELAPRGIRVNTVVPGGARTPIWTRGARAGGSADAAEAQLAPRIPLGAFAEADDIASAVLFLVNNTSMTAAEIVIDGGTTGAPWGAPIYRPVS